MFERRTVIDNSREVEGLREKHYSIELTDKEHMERLEAAKFVYKPPSKEGEMNPAQKDKFEKVRKITKDMKTINLKESNKNVKKKNKNIKKAIVKNNSKSDSPAMAQVQEKL
jgi:hypothetical protein